VATHCNDCNRCRLRNTISLLSRQWPVAKSSAYYFNCRGYFLFFLPKLQPYIASKFSLTHVQFAVIIGTSIGFYDGLIGPGTGAFFSTAYLCLMGLTVVSATAHTKVLNATSNLGVTRDVLPLAAILFGR